MLVSFPLSFDLRGDKVTFFMLIHISEVELVVIISVEIIKQ